MTPWITHSLEEPETIPAKGDVKKLAASSIFLCRVLSCFGAGAPVEIGGYYQPDPALAEAVMRPSKTFNEALAALG